MEEVLTEIPLTGIKKLIGLVGVSVAVLLVTIDQFIVNVSISTIAGELGVSNNNASWAITAYTTASAVSIPFTTWFIKRIGQMRLLALSSVLFGLFSALCGLAFDLQSLVVFRIFQGFVGGPLIPVAQALILLFFPKNKGMAMGLFGLFVMVGPAMGPVLGGWITYDYGWRPIFFINVPICLFVSAAVVMTLFSFESKREKVPIDKMGALFLFLGMACFQVMLDKGYDYDWFKSHIIRMLGVGALVCLSFLIVWEKYEKHPLLNVCFFSRKNFVVATILITLAMAFLFGNLVIGPIWVQALLGYTQEWAGFTLAPLGITALICFPLVGRFLGLMDTRIWVAISFIALATSLLWTAYSTLAIDFRTIALQRLLMGFGFATFYVPLSIIAFSCFKPSEMASASTLFSFARMVGISMGISLQSNYYYRQANFFQERYVGYVIPSNPWYAQYYDLLKTELGLTGKPADAFVYKMVQDQAATETYFQLSYIMGVVILLLILLLPFVSFEKHTP